MIFFEFYQNNSGGHFDINLEKGINKMVLIEAESLEQAVSRAFKIGIYFDGVHKKIDCHCCGDRWYKPREFDYIKIEDMISDLNGSVSIHYLDGRIKNVL